MKAIAIICLAVIASTSSQSIPRTRKYNGPAASLFKSAEFKRFLTQNGIEPLDNFNPDQSSSQEGPDPAKIIESLQVRLNSSREELYNSVENYIQQLVAEFKDYIVGWLENASLFVEKNQYEIGNATIKAIEQALQAKYSSYVANLILVNDNAVEDYNTKTAAISQKLERRLKELNGRAGGVLGGGNIGVITPKVVETQQPPIHESGVLTDLNGNKINLLGNGASELHLPEI